VAGEDVVGSAWQIALVACDIEDFALFFVLVNERSSAMLSSRVFVRRRDKEVVYLDCNVAFSVGAASITFCQFLCGNRIGFWRGKVDRCLGFEFA